MTDTNKIKDYLANAVEDRVFPGCALGWIADGRETVITAGRYTYDDGAPAVTENSVFDCASVTKSIPVGCLALRLIDQGKLSLDDKIKKYIPEYHGNYRDDICVRHLLTHTLDFDFRLSEYKDFGAEKLLGAILGADLRSPPGEKFCYANATSILLGMVIEYVTCKSLHVSAQEVFFDPLEMRDTTFFPKDEDIARCVPTENDPWRGYEVKGEVHDESAWTLREIMTAGSAGMFSTVPDLLKFINMLINNGRTSDGRTEILSSAMIEAMQTNQIPNIPNQQTGLGWELNQEYMGTKRTPTTFGKTGFTGCTVIVDTTRNTGLALLSNYTYPKRKPNRDLINQVRSDIADMVFSI